MMRRVHAPPEQRFMLNPVQPVVKEAGGEAYYQHSPYEPKYGGRFELNLQRGHITQSEEPFRNRSTVEI